VPTGSELCCTHADPEVHGLLAMMLLRDSRREARFRDAYQRARDITSDGAERRFLERRLAELATS